MNEKLILTSEQRIEQIMLELKDLFFRSPYNTYKSFIIDRNFKEYDVPKEIQLEKLIEEEWRDEKLLYLKNKKNYYNLVLETYKQNVLDSFEMTARLSEITWEMMHQPDLMPIDLQRIVSSLDRLRSMEKENMGELRRIGGPEAAQSKEHRENQKHVGSLFAQLREEIELNKKFMEK